MTEQELRQALEVYTCPEEGREEMLRRRVMKELSVTKRPSWGRGAAIAAGVLVMLTAVGLTPVGRAAAAELRQQAAAFIEMLFPPKEVPAMPEGQGETAVYQPRGEEAAKAEPGFVLWVDEERYQVTETEETFRVWPLNWDGTLRDCDLTVRHLPEMSPEAAVEEVRVALAADYAETGEPAETAAGLLVTASDGTAWNDRQAEVHIRSDGKSGSFTITIRYFTEAAEGHGARFRAMLETFAVVQNEK